VVQTELAVEPIQSRPDPLERDSARPERMQRVRLREPDEGTLAVPCGAGTAVTNGVSLTHRVKVVSVIPGKRAASARV